MKVFDYIEDEDGDLEIGSDGDFVVDESTLQHQKDLLIAHKGEYKQNPTVGVGISDFLLGDSSEAEFKKAVQREFEEDGMEVREIRVGDFTSVDIDAEYTTSSNE